VISDNPASNQSSAHWSWDLTAVWLQAGLTMILPGDPAKFLATGFDDWEFEHPILFVDFPGTEPSNHFAPDGKPVYRLWGEVRVGAEVHREWLSGNRLVSLNWPELSSLLRGTGDISISLYDTIAPVSGPLDPPRDGLKLSRPVAPDGSVGRLISRSVIPHDTFSELEETMQALVREAVARAADKERQCRKVELREDDFLTLIG
jgi:hypothetical protein